MEAGINIPTIVGALPVVRFTRLDERHRPKSAGARAEGSAGTTVPLYGLAICLSVDPPGFFLFTCQDDWYPINDTWHVSLAEAVRQAEFEFEGTASTWQDAPV